QAGVLPRGHPRGPGGGERAPLRAAPERQRGRRHRPQPGTVRARQPGCGTTLETPPRRAHHPPHHLLREGGWAMSTKTTWTVDFKMPPVNGRMKTAEVILRTGDGTKVLDTNKADLMDPRERKRVANRIASIVGGAEDDVLTLVNSRWNEAYHGHEK